MKNIASVLLYGSAGLSAVACTTMEKTKTSADIPVPAGNPFLEKSKLQYQAPEFDKIKDEHFKPAFDYGLKVQALEVQKISENTEAPTFENTVLALENSGEVLKRAQSLFYNLTGSNTNDKLQALQQEYAPIFSAHSDKIYLNSKLYERIKKVYENRGGLNSESQKLVEYYKQNFDIAGAGLSDAKKEELKKINGELASLSTQFSNKLLDARKNGALVIDSVKELDGLSSDEIAAAAQAAKEAGHEGKYLLSLLNTTQQPLLQNLKNRATREKLFKASWYRAEKGNADDTRSIIEKLARLRLKKAQVLGKKSFAEWKLQDQMAQNPEEALNLLAQLAKPAVETAKREASEIQKIIDEQKGGFELAPWDWNFYAEQVRKAKYDLDENEIKPYFEVTTVLEKGVFYAAEKFYGITFKERKDLPVYHPDVVAYEVFDRDGKSMALYYLDFYTRNNKGGGAWMSNFVEQSKTLGQKPVIVNVFNYQKPAPGKPSLISYDDVTTMFHEFGHTLHGLFADQDYVSLSGTNVPRDFVEFPSQINEFFALEPEILKNYALHYQTKQPMPQSLIDKIKKASAFNQGYSTTELVAAATLDMAWHSVTSEEQFKPALDFEKEALNKYGLLVEQVPPRYHSPYFAHIWGGGYSAGYYAYMWSDMLNSDAWDWIKNNGGMTRANGDRFRKYILSIGNTKDLNKAYKEFTGRTPDLKPLLKDKGFIK
ncbi:M3 family metallopeptidase [Riemerella anatipestifer]|uniref:Dipeptidyl carboxypeptidase n=1 Tax=Riemerella anatipestifer (strain ATCC 11845 / DSM 15868 / JCM 9532 / NCTC 11014) TaxID=693978 RepID=E4TBH2_RIEAD|nr:M3 family metallopeptidase [Riemerella anatipestifer]ADQ81476.1 peptidyl-dipeptidase Dcp [Riemerella anatipestifer ATCC 11845 = DSM 15868]ADZ13028.1 Zn-dependent oligopeptidase [Riemerella anatipestifer RA-GD]AFD55492.1 peptidyl-dipeptidase dcp [Riemerella anatipestifer ATCC 11845 = DSM 15868]AGC40626.1 Zn-dependent oligopeptidase [Riemerella anatipestifer RA-CH-2]AKP68753.1 peptidyl-dipeptidase dcp [Riemerella anatipestifer]